MTVNEHASKKRKASANTTSLTEDTLRNKISKDWGKFGTDPLAVRQLQANLWTTGLYQGSIDGEPTPSLEAAIKMFQCNFDLPVTGTPTTEFLDTLSVYLDTLQRPAWWMEIQWNDKGEFIRGLERDNIKLKEQMVTHFKTKLAEAQGSNNKETFEKAAEELYKWRRRWIEELKEDPEEATATVVAIPADPTTPGDSRDEREEFARDIKAQFEAWNKSHDCCGLDACTLVAQWMLESNWGRSELTKKTKNLGNIKGKGPAGSVNKVAKEVDPNGNEYSENSNFRKYNSYNEFYADYCKLICKDKRYEAVRGKKGREYFQGLKDAGYATDDKYVEKMMQIYNQLWG